MQLEPWVEEVMTPINAIRYSKGLPQIPTKVYNKLVETVIASGKENQTNAEAFISAFIDFWKGFTGGLDNAISNGIGERNESK